MTSDWLLSAALVVLMGVPVVWMVRDGSRHTAESLSSSIHLDDVIGQTETTDATSGGGPAAGGSAPSLQAAAPVRIAAANPQGQAKGRSGDTPAAVLGEGRAATLRNAPHSIAQAALRFDEHASLVPVRSPRTVPMSRGDGPGLCFGPRHFRAGNPVNGGTIAAAALVDGR